MNISDHHHQATTRHRSLQAKILPGYLSPTCVPHPPWVPPSFSSHNLQKIKTKSQQASHHIPDLQITAHNCAISVSNFNTPPAKKKKNKNVHSLPHWLTLSVKKSDCDRNGDQQSASWERIAREREQTDIGLMMMMRRRSAHDREKDRSRLVQAIHCLRFRAELQQMFSMWPCKLNLPSRSTRPGPDRPGTARVGAVQAYLLHRSSSSSGVLMTDGVVVCMCAKCKQNRVRLCTITDWRIAEVSIYLVHSRVFFFFWWLNSFSTWLKICILHFSLIFFFTKSPYFSIGF